MSTKEKILISLNKLNTIELCVFCLIAGYMVVRNRVRMFWRESIRP